MNSSKTIDETTSKYDGDNIAGIVIIAGPASVFFVVFVILFFCNKASRKKFKSSFSRAENILKTSSRSANESKRFNHPVTPISSSVSAKSVFSRTDSIMSDMPSSPSSLRSVSLPPVTIPKPCGKSTGYINSTCICIAQQVKEVSLLQKHKYVPKKRNVVSFAGDADRIVQPSDEPDAYVQLQDEISELNSASTVAAYSRACDFSTAKVESTSYHNSAVEVFSPDSSHINMTSVTNNIIIKDKSKDSAPVYGSKLSKSNLIEPDANRDEDSSSSGGVTTQLFSSSFSSEDITINKDRDVTLMDQALVVSNEDKSPCYVQLYDTEKEMSIENTSEIYSLPLTRNCSLVQLEDNTQIYNNISST